MTNRTKSGGKRRRKVTYTGPTHKGPLTYEMFEKVSNRLQFDAKEISNWQKYIPLSPEQVANILLADMPKDMRVSLSIEKDGTGSLSFKSSAFSTAIAEFDLKNKVRHTGTTIMSSNRTGNKIGTTYIRNQIEFFKACGVRKFQIYAASDAGGYAWARMGLRPDNVLADDFNESVRAKADARYDTLKAYLTPEERAYVSKILKMKTKKDFAAVADCRIDMGPRLKDVFNRAASGDDERAVRKEAYFDAAYEPNARQHLKEEINDGKAVALGKMLLIGTDWNGTFDLNNPKQMESVGKRVGWHNISIN